MAAIAKDAMPAFMAVKQIGRDTSLWNHSDWIKKVRGQEIKMSYSSNELTSLRGNAFAFHVVCANYTCSFFSEVRPQKA